MTADTIAEYNEQIEALNRRSPTQKECSDLVSKIQKERLTSLVRAVSMAAFEAGAVRIDLEFNGSCDEGSVEAPVFYNEKNEEIKIRVPGKFPSFSGGTLQQKWNKDNSCTANYVTIINEIDSSDFSSAGMDIANDVLDDSGHDWYNNEGGFGHVIIHTEAMYIDLEMNVYEQISHFYGNRYDFGDNAPASRV